MARSDDKSAAVRVGNRRAVLRRAVPLLLILGGLASIVYGAVFHATAIQVQQPSEPPHPNDQAEYGELQSFPPELTAETPRTPTITYATVYELEPALVREVTVGGMALAEAGQIRRTYVGKPPSQCPT